MDRAALHDRRVGGNDRVLSLNDAALWRQHGHAVCRLIDVERDSVLEDPALTLEHGLDQAVDIF